MHLRRLSAIVGIFAVSAFMVSGCGSKNSNSRDGSSRGGWALSINSNPSGALISTYDANQNLREVGRTPYNTTWSPKSQTDAVVISYAAQKVAVIPQQNTSISVDFNTVPPIVTGGQIIK